MEAVRHSWTDDRLDDFRGEVNRRFDDFQADVDRRFETVDRRFDDVDRRLDEVSQRLNGLSGRFDKLNFTLLAASLGAIGTMIVGFAGIIVTQL